MACLLVNSSTYQLFNLLTPPNSAPALLEIECAELATQAVLAVAVVLAQLYEGLAIGSMGGLDAGALPAAGYVVALGGQLLEQGEGALGQVFVHALAATGKEQGRHGVDEQQVERGGWQGFVALATFLAQGVMGAQ